MKRAARARLPWRAALAGLLVCAGVAAPAAAASSDDARVAGAGVDAIDAVDAIDRLVADACDRRVVLLGEDLHHGSGATVAAKAEVAERLIGRCGFSALLFEGQFDDFLALQRAFADGTATQGLLSGTIGGLWSPTADFEPFERFVFERARAGVLLVGGVDPQLGGASQRYSQDRLAADLARVLQDPARSRCAARIDRLANWRFDDAAPYDAAFREGVRECVAGIEAAVAPGGNASAAMDDAAMADVRAMASNLSAYLDMADDDGRRDRAMADNVRWYLDRMPADAKAIVWTASVHAATAPVSGDDGHDAREPMGAFLRRALGEDVAAYGFVALAGAYGSHGRGPFPVAPAEAPLLEAGALDAGAATAYIDGRSLAAAGRAPSRVLDYAHPRTQPWAALFDGILVLRREHPLRTLESPSAPQPAQRQDPW